MQELARVNPMSCQEIERWLHLQADDEIADEDRLQVEDHLSDCEACRLQLAMIERMKVGLLSSAEVEAPASLVARIDDTRKKASRDRRASLALAAAPLLFAATALIVSGLAFFSTDSAPRSEPAETAAGARFADEALAAHQLEVPVDVASQDPRRVARFLERRVGTALEIPRLDDHGLSLAGGRVVSVAERRGAQIVYRSPLGDRLSVVAVPDPSGELFKSVTSTKLTMRHVGNITYAYVGEAAAKLTR